MMKKFLTFTVGVAVVGALAGYLTAKKMALFETDAHDYDEFEA